MALWSFGKLFLTGVLGDADDFMFQLQWAILPTFDIRLSGEKTIGTADSGKDFLGKSVGTTTRKRTSERKKTAGDGTLEVLNCIRSKNLAEFKTVDTYEFADELLRSKGPSSQVDRGVAQRLTVKVRS
jgi:hypothetical protein